MQKLTPSGPSGQEVAKTTVRPGKFRIVLYRYSRTIVVRVDLHYLDSVDPFLRIEHLHGPEGAD